METHKNGSTARLTMPIRQQRNKKRQGASLPITLVIASLLLIVSQPGWAKVHITRAGEMTQDQAKLAEIENRLFFQTYPQDNDLARLSRIERQIFGEVLTGSFSERLTRVTALYLMVPHLNSSTNKTDSKPSGATFDTTSVRQPQPKTTPDSHEPEQRDDQLKFLNMQAKEQEINKLLADGVALWRGKRPKDALAKFQQVLRLDPNNASCHFSMGIIFESQGNLQEAESSYRKALQEQPGNSDYTDAVAQIKKKRGLSVENSCKPDEFSTLAQDAAAAYKRGEYLSACDLYKQLDEKAPNQALVKYNLGTLHLMLGNPVMALAYYKEAVRLKPDESKYIEAYRKLEESIRKDDEERARAEAAWKGQETMPPQMGLPQVVTNPQSNGPKRLKQNSVVFARTKTSSDEVMAEYGILAKSNRDGVNITTIGIGSRAAKAGLQKNDIIRAVDGMVVKSLQDVNRILSGKDPNLPVRLMIERELKMGEIIL